MGRLCSTGSTVTSQADWLHTLTGTRIRIKTPGHETQQRLTVIDYIEPPDSAPPIFTRHEFVEIFCVVSGTLTFQFLNEQRFSLLPGQNVTCPSWKPHSFWNETDQPVSVLLVCSPSGLDDFFVESDQLRRAFADDACQGDAWEAAMTELRARHGLEHVGSPPQRRD